MPGVFKEHAWGVLAQWARQRKQSRVGRVGHFRDISFYSEWDGKSVWFWAGEWYDQIYSFAGLTQSADLLNWDGTMDGQGWKQEDPIGGYCANPG